MNALIDTCVVLDALEARGEFSLPARKIIDFAALNRFDGFPTAASVMDIYGVVLSRLGDAVEEKGQWTPYANFSTCWTRAGRVASTRFFPQSPIT